jgi:quinol monooxygenase YgiN
MPYFVAVQYEARPDRLDDLVGQIRHDFAVSATAHPGRRFARVFQHHQEPCRLLAIEEWQQRSEFQQHFEASQPAEVLLACASPPQASTLERLQHYRHMPHQPTALACTTIAAPADRADEVERFICDDERRDALMADGLAIRAVYRLDGITGQLLVLHGWRTRGDLDTYVASAKRRTITGLAAIGTAVEQFTGEVVAQYSWLNG